MDYAEELVRFLSALHQHAVEYVLIGGAAMNLHGLVRATQDIDLFIAPNAANVARLKQALRAIWADPHIDEISAEDLCGAYPAVRYGPPEGDVFLDILTRLGEHFRYEDVEFETVAVGGTVARVATPGMLFRMKRDTVREIDKADARALRDAFEIDDDDGRAR